MSDVRAADRYDGKDWVAKNVMASKSFILVGQKNAKTDEGISRRIKVFNGGVEWMGVS